jgi:hypothetical protein
LEIKGETRIAVFPITQPWWTGLCSFTTAFGAIGFAAILDEECLFRLYELSIAN